MTFFTKDTVKFWKALAKNNRVAGVIVHINSPGGSALASDLIWREIDRLRRRKPVVAYCSDIAASGGYYMAVGCDKIICREETITGSIGVVAGKMSGGGIAEKLGIDVDVIGDDSTSMLSAFAPMDEETLNRFADDARTFYRRFLERVGQARNLSKRRLHRYARGRVYTGSQALERGLVDGLGGFDAAVDMLLSEIAKDDQTCDPNPVFVSHQKRDWRANLRRSLVSGSTSWLDQNVSDAVVAHTIFKNERVVALCPHRLT